MNKRRLHHFWTWFRVIKPRYLLAAALVAGTVCVIALRANNQHMANLRAAVFTADKDNGDVQGALHNLQAYVTSHMNTSLSTGNASIYPPIQLQYTYQRLVDQQGGSLQSANGSLYTAAENYCQAKIPTGFSGSYRISCIEDYVQQHGVNVSLPTIDKSLYQFDFIAPKWSPDLAGWSLLISVGLFVMALLKLLADRWFKRRL